MGEVPAREVVVPVEKEQFQRDYIVVAYWREDMNAYFIELLSRKDKSFIRAFEIPGSFFENDFLDPSVFMREQDKLNLEARDWERRSAKNAARSFRKEAQDEKASVDFESDEKHGDDEVFDYAFDDIEGYFPYRPLDVKAEKWLLIISQIDEIQVVELPKPNGSQSGGKREDKKKHPLITPEIVKKAGQRVVYSNMLYAKGLSLSFYYTFHYDTPPLNDLFQEACLGMGIALQHFDISKKNGALNGSPFPRFLTYAHHWIVNRLKLLRASDRAIPIPINVFEDPLHYAKAVKRAKKSGVGSRKRGPNKGPSASDLSLSARDVYSIDEFPYDQMDIPDLVPETQTPQDTFLRTIENALLELQISPEDIRYKIVVEYVEQILDPVTSRSNKTGISGKVAQNIAKKHELAVSRVKEDLKTMFALLSKNNVLRSYWASGNLDFRI